MSERSKRNAMERVRRLTPRNWGRKLDACIAQINAWLRGWHGFFGIASASGMQMMRKLDAHIRRRLRAIILRHWKRKRTIAKRLVALGVPRRSAWKQLYQGRRSWWALSHTHAVDQGLRNAYFAKRGLKGVAVRLRMPTLVLGTPPPELDALLERRRRADADRFDEVWEGVYHMVPVPSHAHGRTEAQTARTAARASDRRGVGDHQPVQLGRVRARLPGARRRAAPSWRGRDVASERRARDRDRLAGRRELAEAAVLCQAQRRRGPDRRPGRADGHLAGAA